MQATRALLLTDVVDSTQLAQTLGDAEMAQLWTRHDRAARDLLAMHHGREIDKTDGFLLLFENASDAVDYAVAYHAALEHISPLLRARAGLHVGSVHLHENLPEDVARGAKPLEVEGLAKPLAARVMSLAVGGQTLLTTDAVDALGEDHGYRHVRHGFWRLKGVGDPVELHEIGVQGAPFSPPPDAAKAYRVVRDKDLWLPAREVPHELPRERDPFVGRTRDLHELAARLDGGARLVSVMGIGGTGKTRLLVRYGWAWLGDWPGGVWFCDLSDARSVEGMCAAVSRALGIPLGKTDPVEQLGNAIDGRGRCLVVLDNFEQLVALAPETLGVWLDRAANASFVVTTRALLGLPGEEAFSLAPLGTADAVQLFEARGAAVKRGFSLSAADRTTVTELVELLDCLPLAIELAAARVRVMPPAKLLERMGQRFRLLASRSGRRDRQATLRGAIDWSWDLLSEAERTGLAQLSVFEGGLTLEAAEAVLDVGDEWPTDIVQALVDKSMVRQVTDDRFDLLMSVREYGTEKLEEAGITGSTQIRHGEWYAENGTPEALAALNVHGGVECRRALSADIDNLVAACQRAIARGDSATATATLAACWEVFYLEGPMAMGTRLAEAVQALPDLSVSDRVKVREVIGRALWMSGDRDASIQMFEAAVTDARQAGATHAEAVLERHIGDALQNGRNQADAEAHYRRALELQRADGDRQQEGHTLRNLGVLFRSMGDTPKAVELYEQATAIDREVGNRIGLAASLGNLGLALEDSGDARSLPMIYEALEIQRELGNRRTEGQVLTNLGSLLDQAGDPDGARAHYEQAIAIYRVVGDPVSLGIALGNLGTLERSVGHLEASRERSAEALALHRRTGFEYGVPYWLSNLAVLETHDGDLEAGLTLAHEAVEAGAPFPTPRAAALWSLAWVQLHRGAYDDARTALQEARVADPSHAAAARANATEALIRLRSGDADGARTLLRAAESKPEHCAPKSEVGQIVERVRNELDALA